MMMPLNQRGKQYPEKSCLILQLICDSNRKCIHIPDQHVLHSVSDADITQLTV